jgi:competence protein ComEC
MLEITVWDVGHGHATYIKTPNNRHIVVDLGDDGEDNFSPLRTLHGRGIQRLDVVVITHPHRDHLDDIFNFNLLAPPALYVPRHLSDADIRSGNRASDLFTVLRYLEIRQLYTAPLPPANDLTVPANFGGATFQVFAPNGCDVCNLNNHSLVVVVSYAGLKMVLPGDNESASWNELLANPNFVAAIKGADVLLAPHHGRDAGYCADLFKAMGKPKLVVISDGRFGDTSATDRYCAQATGWTVFNGAGVGKECKCVTTRSDGHITIKLGWNNEAERANFLNVTTSKPDPNGWAALMFGPPPSA